MDIYSKVFLINFVLLMSVACADKYLLDNRLENTQVVIDILGWWAGATFLAFPVWVIWLIYNA